MHGISVADPYRWLEEQDSPQTRAWISEQTLYARTYLDSIPGRERIRQRTRELLDIESCDSFLKAGNRYFFRRRKRGQEQPGLYFREGPNGDDQLLVDPAARRSGDYTAVKPLCISANGSLLLYEVKQGGERMGTFELLDVEARLPLADRLPHGYLRGFAFAPDGESFYYVHEPADANLPFRHTARHHVLGTDPAKDREIFYAGEGRKLRLALVSGESTVGFLIYQFREKAYIDFYLWRMGSTRGPVCILRGACWAFRPYLLPGVILASTDAGAPNGRIVEVQPQRNQNPLFIDVVPETEVPIRDWRVTKNKILVSYIRGTKTQIVVFDLTGRREMEIPCEEDESVRVLASCRMDDEVLLSRESFVRPVEVIRFSTASAEYATWAGVSLPFDPLSYGHTRLSFLSSDGTRIPFFLVGRRELLADGSHPVIMTAYGGFGVPMTPQFSVFVTFLLERGCLFALPNIRGGSEFGRAWHEAARGRRRQVAFDDFLSCAEWLVRSGRAEKGQLAIFGGSNSGLLVGAALTQRPDLFCAVLCIAPMLDLLRYHLFDNAHVWTEEFGTAENPEDFRALLSYSPYHAICDGTVYPPTLIVSGDADQNCNALHARKMTARLQATNPSGHPVLLDYSEFRGHSPVLPLSTRVNALTDRLSFFCDQMQLTGEEAPSCYSSS
jgi:prolyl oligopeptidase